LDKAALDRLVDEHLPAALRFALRLTGDLDAAEDLVQDALLRVAGRWSGFRGDAQFRTWLFQIVVNVFRDRLRRPRMQALVDDVDDRRRPGPAEAALDAELGEIVARKIAELPPRQREVLVLSFYEQMPAAEIAEVVGISESNVYSTLHQARARLKRELAEYLE
jgi:RNA polymerase sigma-70 factor, ECF subfamily